MRVLVVGAGVSGAACAIGLRSLRELGVQVTVYEANPDPAGSVGSFLSLAGNGLRALDALGCLEQVQRVGFPVARQRIWSSSGRLLGDVPRGRLSGDPLHSITLKRGHLVEQLRSGAQTAGAEVVTGRRLVSAETGPDGVRAAFDDGSRAEADLLVGADGIWSTTRRLLDPGAPVPKYAGIYSVAGSTPSESLAVTVPPGAFNMVFAQAGAFLYLTAGDGTIWWAAQVADPREPAETRSAESLFGPGVSGVSGSEETAWSAAGLAALFRHEQVPSAILRAATVIRRPTLEHVLDPVRVWNNHRIVLVGDAAHPVGAGQGASMALEDAVVLTSRLRAARADSPTARMLDPQAMAAALTGYTTARQARTAKMVKAASANRDAKTAGPIARRVNDVIMPIFFRHFYERATAWLYAAPDEPAGPQPSACAPAGPVNPRRQRPNHEHG